MRIFKSLLACFSIYSKIKMPVTDLDSDDMRYVFIFFPLVGLVIGLIEFFVFYGCSYAGFNNILRVALLTVFPVIITGGIHIDGFMDVSDAFNSYGDREKKLAIMKDPHIGAFAVISLLVYGILYIGLLSEITEKSIIPFCLGFVISRIMSGISVVTIKSAKDTGMISSVKDKSSEKTVLYFLVTMFIILFFVFIKYRPINGIISCVISICGYFVYKKKSLKELDGITGDTSGYYLCVMELILLAVAVLVSFF
ncbi:MAG: adenosylcobinamide-GDP ribazoletransferase [Lachnospiraceae bacterium]|nr:adenosylcobinamide-GDP ribazoletransferase [Lachnospiraceae bacterium]